MLFSIPPFFDENIDVMFNYIKNEEVRFPKKNKNNVSKEAIDLISNLLVKDPKERLGYKSGSLQILSHKFFESINSNLIFKKLAEPPCKPVIKNVLDLSNFDSKITNQNTKMSITSYSNLKLIKKNQFLFNKFDN